MTRASIAGLLLATGLIVASPLALDRIGGEAASADHAGPAAGDPAGPTGTGGGAGSSQEGAPSDDRPEPSRKITPAVVPPRGSLIKPAQPIPVKPPDAPFKTIAEVGGQPVRWDSCTPIRYVVRRQAGPPNGFEMVQEALQRTSDASGLTFQFEGFTDLLRDDWVDGPGAAGEADVWIGWAFDDEIPDLGPESDHHVGLGGPGWESDSPRATTGSVVLRSDTALDHRFGAGTTYGNVLLHEVGHLVGLDHSLSKADLMFGSLESTAPESWGPGDLAGLYSLGSAQPCF